MLILCRKTLKDVSYLIILYTLKILIYLEIETYINLRIKLIISLNLTFLSFYTSLLIPYIT